MHSQCDTVLFHLSPRDLLLTTLLCAVSDYGDENPLFYDYYGFQPELYKLKFKSRGDSAISQRIVDAFSTVSAHYIYLADYFLDPHCSIGWSGSKNVSEIGSERS